MHLGAPIPRGLNKRLMEPPRQKHCVQQLSKQAIHESQGSFKNAQTPRLDDSTDLGWSPAIIIF